LRPLRRRTRQCRAIGVATGHDDRAALLEAGADHVLETLEEELPLT
jgi:phosphoglycolate phosphatase-like HAD superfamily hydrolase